MGTTTKVVDREYLTKQFKNFNDTLVKPGIEDLDDRKVDKIAGKGLSKNDFTDALKTKLEGLENVELETEPIDFYALDSDEFTYTKTPGTISKLFVHLFRNPVYLDNESADLRNSDGYVVDADGVVRYEFGQGHGNSVYKIDDDNDIVAVFNANLTEDSSIYSINESLLNSDGDNNDAYDKLLDDISKDESGKFSGMNANSETITLSTRNQLQNLIQSALSIYSNSNSHDYYNDEDDAAKKISISPRVDNAFILSSDKLFAKYNMSSNGSPDGMPVTAYYDFDEASFTISYVLQKWNDSDYRQNESYGFHGLSIIEKALETGRALDIGIDITNLQDSWWVN